MFEGKWYLYCYAIGDELIGYHTSSYHMVHKKVSTNISGIQAFFLAARFVRS